jgi:hypothetical protein
VVDCEIETWGTHGFVAACVQALFRIKSR